MNYLCVTSTLIIIAQLIITVQSNLKQTECENISNEIWQYVIFPRIYLLSRIFTFSPRLYYLFELRLRIVNDYDRLNIRVCNSVYENIQTYTSMYVNINENS